MNLTKYISTLIHKNGSTGISNTDEIYSYVSKVINAANENALKVNINDNDLIITLPDIKIIINKPNDILLDFFKGISNTYNVEAFCTWFKLNKIPKRILNYFNNR